MNLRRILPLAALAAAAAPLLAQLEEPLSSPAPQADELFRAWSAEHGPSWHLYQDPATGQASMLYGGQAGPRFAPREDADFAVLAREFVEETAGITGIEGTTLVLERVKYLPLAQVGSTDKIAVRFRQQVGGVPVLSASVNALFDLQGNLLALQTTALPRVAALTVGPALDADRAAARALEVFDGDTGLPGAVTAGPRLAIGKLLLDGALVPALVWTVDVQWHGEDAQPEGTTYWIDAVDGAVLRRENNVHNDVGGTVSTMATPGTLPDTGSNPEVSMPAGYIRVSSSAGTVTADVNGNFNYPGATGPLNVTIEYVGDFATVQNEAGAEYVLNQSISGTGNALLMNPSPSELLTAQSNAYVQIGALRDWLRSVDPTDDTADFQAWANVNLNQNCNAYFDGSSVNFYTSGGGCVNTAYSTVVSHEMGHWLNVRYGTGNGSDGMGEGNSDVFSMYLYDTPIVGEDFCGSGCDIRTGWNNRQFCGDCCPGCYGQVHADGEVWMGAAWKVRNNLNLTHGDSLGDAIADSLFSSWMNTYDQQGIQSVIEIQWLTLDDDDGTIDNGTPNYDDIDAAFRTQGFPGFDLPAVQISDVTQLPDTLDEAGPYAVEATMIAAFFPPITSSELTYRVNGGPWITVPMFPIGADVYAADIPGQSAISEVEYYVQGEDGNGNSNTFPDGGPSDALSFYVGKFVLLADDFEGAGDNGWSHGTFGDTPNDHDDFQRGNPDGDSGDPANAYSGMNVWANDLGNPGWNGAYQDNQHNWLRTPVFDCSLATGTTLEFARWLNVQQGTADQARISVNGTEIWVNAPSTDLTDFSWKNITIDISAYADGLPQVQIEWSMQTNPSGQYGGWTIDDVEVSYVPANPCPDPIPYGEAKTNSLGLEARMGWNGTPRLATGNFEVTLTQAIPNQPAVLFSGDAVANMPFYGGFKLVANPITREATYTLDLFGESAIPIPVTPPLVGTTKYYQTWYRDPADPAGFGVGLSDGLEVTFCD